MPKKKAEETTGDKAQWGNIAADRLISGIERIERLIEERKAIGSDLKDIFAEMKSAGFDPKVIRKVIVRRARERADVEEEDTMLDVYERAIGGERVNSLAPVEDDI